MRYRRFSLVVILYWMGLLHGAIYHAWLVGIVIWPDAMFYAMMTLPLFLFCMLIRVLFGTYVVEVRR